MADRLPRMSLLLACLLLAAHIAAAQRVAAGDVAPSGRAYSFDHEKLNMTMLDREASQDLSPLQDMAISVSRLDFKAPTKARREYYAGYRLLSEKNYQSASEHLSRAASTYPDFVAAHIALGSAYLGLRQNELARDEFAKALALDDHLPISYLDLACAELALQHYAAAEEAVQKASSMAPLDQQVLTALAYAQLLNHHYEAAVDTAHRVHSRAHRDAAVVHYYAAAAWDAQHNLEEAERELQKLLEEDPKSPVAEHARGILQKIRENGARSDVAPSLPITTALESTPVESGTMPGQGSPVQELMQAAKEPQAAGVEAICGGCDATSVALAGQTNPLRNPEPRARLAKWADSGWSYRSSVDEVAVVFAAIDHGRAVSDLTRAEVTIRDDGKAPAAVTGFRSEAQLPLRLGLVIDTSESITSRFSFEQSAAGDFVSKVLTGKKDLGFVVGFSNSVLLVQDFTGDSNKISEAINKLAPAGGTALWDAVAFASDKLVQRPETEPVARVLVVISDGNNNSSSLSLERAIATAEDGDVIIYVVSTHENLETNNAMKDEASVGDRALRALAESTGGKAFFPGSIGYMDRSLGDLQQVIRGRYFLSYKPALFKRDGRFRSIDISARKAGRRLHVYARKGYYARQFPSVAEASDLLGAKP